MSEADQVMSANTVESVVESVGKVKKKRPMSEEALQKLALARQKAAEVKARMKETKLEIDKLQPKPLKKIDVLNNQLAELKAAKSQVAEKVPDKAPEKKTEERTHHATPKRDKVKTKSRPVVILEKSSSSSSEDDEERKPVVYVRKKPRAKEAPPPAKSTSPTPTPLQQSLRTRQADNFYNPFFGVPQLQQQRFTPY